MKKLIFFYLVFLLITPFVNGEIYDENFMNLTDFPIDYFRYGNELSTGQMFTPFLILVIGIILYLSISGFDVKPKQKFAAAAMIYSLLGGLAFIAQLANGFWLVTYVVAFSLSIVALIVGKET